MFDADGRLTNPDAAVGEIVDKQGAAAFEGYYKNDAADAERLRHGWYWTGDLGYLDADGFLYFAGRQGDWIRVDGENISALTIERVLRRHRPVIAAAVYAVPDPRSGDQVMAALEVADPHHFDTVAFADYLSTQKDLGAKGIPRLLRLSARLPVTGSNKILKRRLQAEAWHTGDPLYRWAGRGTPVYTAVGAAQQHELDAEFDRHGQTRRLPAGAQRR